MISNNFDNKFKRQKTRRRRRRKRVKWYPPVVTLSKSFSPRDNYHGPSGDRFLSGLQLIRSISEKLRITCNYRGADAVENSFSPPKVLRLSGGTTTTTTPSLSHSLSRESFAKYVQRAIRTKRFSK